MTHLRYPFILLIAVMMLIGLFHMPAQAAPGRGPSQPPSAPTLLPATKSAVPASGSDQLIVTAPDAIITVQSAADDGAADVTRCPGANCRLRDAIERAVSGDTLIFAGDYTINLSGSELTINKNLTIDGAGHTIIINGSGASCSPCFRVFNIASGSTVTLNALTIGNGRATDNRFGGGLINAGTLTVSNSTFSGNSAPWGGGLQNSGVLTVLQSTFIANTATSGGAGLESGGGSDTPAITALIVNSTFVNNIASDGGGIGTGGGMQLDGGLLNLANVTIANNLANGTADDGGGGVMIYFGTATISNSTIAGNTTANTNSEGAGISVNRYTGSATLGLYNTIVDQSGLNCSQTNGGAITANSDNLATDSTCGSATQATHAQIQLGPLASNGGAAQTMATGTDSVAIDAGDAATCAAAPVNSLDQRGQPRSDLQCDVGAFELEYSDSPTVQRPVSSAVVTTFGPALMGIQRAAGFTDPGIITVTKYSGSTLGPAAIGAAWVITPTTGSGFNLTLKLCYTVSELGLLTEANLRFWHYDGSTWIQVGGAPALSMVGGNHCAQVSDITTGGAWTLATDTPNAATITLSPSPATIAGCDTAQVQVVINDVVNLYDVDIRLAFDPAALEVVDADSGKAGIQVLNGGFLVTPLILFDTADNTAGTIRFVATQLNPTPPANGTGPLVNILFRAKLSGATPLTFTLTQLSDPNGQAIAVTAINGSATSTGPTEPAVTISKVNATDARLSWTASASAANYRIYRATTPYFTPVDPPYTTTTGLLVTDTNVLGDPGTNHYYVIRSTCANGLSSDNSSRVGEYDYALTAAAASNKNDIALVLNMPAISNASALANYVGSSARRVSRFNTATQSFQTYIVGIPATDFSVTLGQFLFVITDNTAPASIALVGGVPNAGTVSFPLVSGSPALKNFLSVPLDKGNITRASEVTADIGTGVSRVTRFRIETQSFQSYIPGLPATDFLIVIGEPIGVNLSIGAPSNWP